MCSYVYELYRDQNFKKDTQYSEQELKEAFVSPIHLHYPGQKKPWKDKCTKDEVWHTYSRLVQELLNK
jgi:lipopolysaccharide biosynthesis glycosyltransferase